MREKGTVKLFNPHKGYGFISLDKGRDIFVHQTEIDTKGYRILWEGQRVECDVVRREGDKRYKAANVVVVDDPDAKKRYPYCPICNGSGLKGNAICNPCNGDGVLSSEAVYGLYLGAEAASERRYQREQEWKRKYRKNKKIFGWLKGNSCSSSCRRSRKKRDKLIRKQGNVIQWQRKLLDDAGIDYKKLPTSKRGSFKAISEDWTDGQVDSENTETSAISDD